MNVAILGFGTVGVGVYDLLKNRTDLCVKYVLDKREIPELGDLLVHEMDTILCDSDVDIVIEVMGGLHPSFEFVSAALRAKKHVVTANKYLICTYFQELTQLAAEHGVALRCTAAAGGGIPWLVNLERAKRVDSINRIWGIMNGTTNFILDSMHRKQASFDAALTEAQALGYAEADPSADVDGWDIQRKLILSANIAFDCLLDAKQVPTCGIRHISAEDVAAFRENGMVCKLLARANHVEHGVAAYVEPTLVTDDEPESAVPFNFNLISFVGEAVGRLSYFGQGAGRYPTGCNCVQDCLDILGGKGVFYSQRMQKLPVDNEAICHPYYVRTDSHDAWLDEITDKPFGKGVLTKSVSVRAMHEWLKEHKNCFIAGIAD